MKILHFGDLHVWSARPLLREFYAPKRWLGPINLLLRRARRFPPAYRQAALNAILMQDADVVLFTGDFTNFSLEQEFREAARLFAPLREKWGDRLIAIPGNHDVYTPGSVRSRLLEQYLPWVETAPAWRRELAPNQDLIGVHHAVPLRIHSNGIVTDQTQMHLETQLQAARSEGRRSLVMGHFAYATPPEHPETNDHRLIGEERLASLLAQYAPDAYLHGHKHVRWLLRPDSTPETVCLNCGSVSMSHEDSAKQAGFLRFEWKESGEIAHVNAHTYKPVSGDWVATPLG